MYAGVKENPFAEPDLTYAVQNSAHDSQKLCAMIRLISNWQVKRKASPVHAST